LGGGAYTGPLVTKTLLFLGLRGDEAPDLVLGTAAQAELVRNLGLQAAARPEPPITAALRAFDKTTGETVHSVELNVPPTGTPMTYMLNGKQYIVLAYGTGSSSGLIGLALN
jgi:hypothetical protein